MKTLKLIGLWCQLRALEATLYGQEEALIVVRDPETINAMLSDNKTCQLHL